jgi:gliding motility-associated-like protein
MLVAENNNLCFDTAICNITVHPIPIITSVVSNNNSNSFTANIQLQSSGADSCYLIYNNDTLVLQLCDSTSLVQEFPGTGIQNLTYLVKNQYGCVAQYNFAVDIKDATFIYVPNAFSPNNDGINDVFIPWFVKSPTFYLLSIYDRWSKKVFESNSTQRGWDGNYINGPASLGVYVYVIQYALPGYGETKILKGNLSLLR